MQLRETVHGGVKDQIDEQIDPVKQQHIQEYQARLNELQIQAHEFMKSVSEESRTKIATKLKELSHQCMDEVSFIDRLAKVAFQVDPDFNYTENET
jgi:hypothetical protein